MTSLGRGLAGVVLAAVMAAGGLVIVAVGASPPPQTSTCPGGRLLFLTNGRIHTMDAARTVVSRVLIANGTFVVVGDGAAATADGCTDTIDLAGRTVIPGMIDNHFHVQLVGQRPGWETRALETAFSIAEAQAVIRERTASVPAGWFLTGIGGIQARQFTENRLPTLDELDAVAPNHPVYIHASFNGPATTNTIGKKFFESKGIAVGADGAIAQNGPSWDALDALRATRTLADKKRTMVEVFSYFNKVGLTTVHSILGSQERGPAQYVYAQDNRPMHELLAEDRLTLRLRLYQNTGERVDGKPGNYPLRTILDSQMPYFGDDMVRTTGVGEHMVDWPLEGAVPMSEVYFQHAQLLAERGWQLIEHSMGDANHAARMDVWERVNQRAPVTDLRWSLDHVLNIKPETLERVKKLGAGVRAHGIRWFAGPAPEPAGPPYRQLIDSGVRVGAGFDGAQAAPIDPWLHIYYMVTGRNVRDELINDGQQITRQEAVWLYTGAQGWFSREERTLGIIAPGYLADVVVLNADVFDQKAVPDAAIKRVHSVLTILGGRTVWGNPATLR